MTRPVVSPDELESIDLADPRLHAERDLTEVWRRLRGEEPFYWQPPIDDRPGFWVITRHADAMAVYRDRDNFTTERGNALENLLVGGDPAAGSMLAVTDGTKHTRLRNVLNAAFAPKTLARIRQGLRRSVDDLIAVALEKGECDFVHDVAESIPLGAICDLLGVPESDRRYLLDRTANAWSSEDADRSADDAWQAKSELLLYFADLANSRRGTEADDVISLLANCQVDGEPLSDRDVMANCYGLIIGGDETGRHAISSGLKTLIEQPEQWRALKEGRADLPTAADEVLRWTVPSLHGGRTATADVSVNGRLIKAGDIVTVWISSANRDESVFGDADRFLVDRKPNKHLTFAFGAHICLGHNLARIEVEEVLGALRTLVSSAEQIGQERWIYSSILNGMSEFPVALKPEVTG